MEYETDTDFWDAALRDFPGFPHLTKFRLIYHYCMPDEYNLFRQTDLPDEDSSSAPSNTLYPSYLICWTRFGSIISNRDRFPLLEVVDACPTYGSQFMDPRRLFHLLSALKTPPSGRLTHWGNDWTHPE